ncbi:MAG: hypothetical protein D6746_08515 [Bacteroidetes bacterium]|nr:MAG: hypothetical protein D6746_08515 [Bacteroidota bacterium]
MPTIMEYCGIRNLFSVSREEREDWRTVKAMIDSCREEIVLRYRRLGYVAHVHIFSVCYNAGGEYERFFAMVNLVDEVTDDA